MTSTRASSQGCRTPKSNPRSFASMRSMMCAIRSGLLPVLNQEEAFDHPRRIPDDRNLASWYILPVDRHFLHLVTGLGHCSDQFTVERKAVLAQRLRNRRKGLPRDDFET